MSSAHNRPSPESGTLSYRPDIDGLRAVAVAIVVAFHVGVPGFGGGFVGVDVFFVISGFLITGLLVKELLASGHISLSRFYARRVRRLLPALVLVGLVTVGGGERLVSRFPFSVGRRNAWLQVLVPAGLIVAGSVFLYRFGMRRRSKTTRAA